MRIHQNASVFNELSALMNPLLSNMLRFKKLFPSPCSVVGMVHVDPLPGSPLFAGNIQSIINKACKEAEIYLKHGIHGIMVENMHDIPYVQAKYLGPETTAAMARIATEIRKIVPQNVPCGIQVLSGGNREALAIAQACAFNFIRCEGYVFAHIGDEGFMDAQAGELLRYRKYLGAEDIMIFADIKKKHSSHAITSDISLLETAHAANFFLSDALIITGTATGQPTNTLDLGQLKSASDLPIIVGSGVTVENVDEYLQADALIVGSYFKEDGRWEKDLNEKRVEKLLEKVHLKI